MLTSTWCGGRCAVWSAGLLLDDAVQDVFVVVHGKLDGFEGRSSLKTWVLESPGAWQKPTPAGARLRPENDSSLSESSISAHEANLEQLDLAGCSNASRRFAPGET